MVAKDLGNSGAVIIIHKGTGNIVAIVSVEKDPPYVNNTDVLKDWCKLQGLSDKGWMQFNTEYGPIIDYESIKNLLK